MSNASTPQWIDADYSTKVGDVLFLREVKDTSNGGTRWTATDSPLHTNQSHEPRLWGWCGETDNRSRYARGLVRVTKLTSPRDGYPRARIQQIRGAELAAALETLGYPELTPSEVEA